MIDELCEICKHYAYDFNVKSIICQLNNESPSYFSFCDFILPDEEEKNKIIENFRRNQKEHRSLLKRVLSTQIIRVNRSMYSNIKPDNRIELRNSKSFLITNIVFISLVLGGFLYFLIFIDFDWHPFISIIVLVFGLLLGSLIHFFNSFRKRELKILIDSKGIEIKSEHKFIPWELMFEIFISEDNSGEDGSCFLHIWSLIGDFKISLHELNYNINEIDDYITYYKNQKSRFNKLEIK